MCPMPRHYCIYSFKEFFTTVLILSNYYIGAKRENYVFTDVNIRKSSNTIRQINLIYNHVAVWV